MKTLPMIYMPAEAIILSIYNKINITVHVFEYKNCKIKLRLVNKYFKRLIYNMLYNDY